MALIGASAKAEPNLGFLLAASSLALTSLTAPAVAQTDSQAVIQGGLDEVVVTAQRRQETLQSAAIAVDVVDADELQNAGISNATALNSAVPALLVTRAGGSNTSYYVRGVGNFTVNAYADPAIAFNLDGVYLGRPTSTVGAFFDLTRVEVLKGPQGTLYGRNATGGAVNVIPNRPVLGDFGGFVAAGYGSFNALDLEGAVNVPLGERAALRVAGKVLDAEGYNDDGTNDDVGHAVRAQLLIEPNEALSIRIAGDYSYQGGVGPGASFNGLVRYTPGTPATSTSIANYTFSPFTLDPFSGLHSPQSRQLFSTFTIPGAFINPAPNEYPFLDNEYWGANIEATLDTGVGTFTFIPAYRQAVLDSRFNGPAFRAGLVDETDEQVSAELRLDGKSIGPVDWLLGLYYFDENITVNYTFNQYNVTPFQEVATGTESHAIFGRATLNVTDDFRLVGGVRYTEDEKYFKAVAETLVQICTNPPPPAGPGCFGGPSVPAVRTRLDLPFAFPTIPGPANSVAFGTFGNRLFFTRFTADRVLPSNRTTFRVAAEYDAGPSSLLYASYETGFRGGGFSNSFGHESYEPEYVNATTIGSKNRFFDNRLQLNLEAFNWSYDNQQVTHFGFDSNNNSSLFTENLGESTIRGADVDVQFLLTPATLLRGSVQYLDNTIDSFVYTTPRGGTNLTPVTGCKVSNGTQGALLTYVVDCSGLPGFNSPEWSINAGIEQTLEFGAHELVFNLDARYRSDRVIGFERLPQQQSGDTTTFDASARYGDKQGDWSIVAYVRNISDEAVPVLAQHSGSTGGSVSTNYAPPRTYGVRVARNF